MPKLTDTQLVMLSAAAQRADGAVELPENPKGAASQKKPRQGFCAKALSRRFWLGATFQRGAAVQAIHRLPC